MIAVKMKTTKKLTPPSEGFDSLLHLITTSLLFRIPKDLENLNNISLQSMDNITAPNPKPKNSKNVFKIF